MTGLNKGSGAGFETVGKLTDLADYIYGDYIGTSVWETHASAFSLYTY